MIIRQQIQQMQQNIQKNSAYVLIKKLETQVKKLIEYFDYLELNYDSNKVDILILFPKELSSHMNRIKVCAKDIMKSYKIDTRHNIIPSINMTRYHLQMFLCSICWNNLQRSLRKNSFLFTNYSFDLSNHQLINKQMFYNAKDHFHNHMDEFDAVHKVLKELHTHKSNRKHI